MNAKQCAKQNIKIKKNVRLIIQQHKNVVIFLMNNLNPMHSFIENKNNISFSELYKAYLLYGKYLISNLSE